MHQGLCCPFTDFAMPVTLFLVGAATHSQSLWGLLSWVFPFVGQLQSDQIILGPIPPIQKSTIETTLMEFGA